MTVIDHLIWATPDLDQGIAAFRQLTGVQARMGGSHPGLGTRNALLSLGPKIYLEIIAPDPAQELAGTYGGVLTKLTAAGMFTVSARSDDMGRTHAQLRKCGLDSSGPIAMGRKLPNGGQLTWRIMMVEPGAFGWEFPFFIDWGTVPVHPSDDSPGGCTLKHLRALSPDAAALEPAYRGVGLSTPVGRAMRAGFEVVLDTPRGELILNGADGAGSYASVAPRMLEVLRRGGAPKAG